MKKPPRLLRLVSCLATIVVTGGCVSATFIPTQSAAYPSKDRHYNIEVFSSAVPDREYEEIGIVEGEGSAWKSDSWGRGARPEETPSSSSRVTRSRNGEKWGRT